MHLLMYFFPTVTSCAKRTKIRPQTSTSRCEIICLRNGKLCLVFRVSDRHGKHLIRTKIDAYLIREKRSTEGELIVNYFASIKLENCGVFLWPTDVVHHIDETSPLWDVSANDLMSLRFEILVALRGDSIYSGQTSQSRISYVSKEILWGHRFESCTEISANKTRYFINYRHFDKTSPFDTPLCSARRLAELQGHVCFSDAKNQFKKTSTEGKDGET